MKRLSDYEEYINNHEFEKAATFSAKHSNIPVYKSYRGLAFFIRKNKSIKNRHEIADSYLRKGCDAGDYHACRREADLIQQKGNLEEAEKIYIHLATNYPDPASAGNLVTMYHNKKWEGYNPEEAKYWRLKIPKLAKDESNK